jgi:glycosyltransferase involved in cell wall biosynthesis
MRVAIIHDYIKEYGGAERVLEALCEIYPEAPIYTAFVDKNGTAYAHFKNKKIISSWANSIPFFKTKLHSPLRFLAPFIWESFDLSGYDLIISSASWYITKGFRKRFDKSHFIEFCYCHTPPRWLYGYTTSVNFQKHILVKVYAAIVGHLMRLYDFKAAEKVNYFIANSKEVAGRIKKFYRRDSEIIYPPVDLPKLSARQTTLRDDVQLQSFKNQSSISASLSKIRPQSKTQPNFNSPASNLSRDYYLIVSRITGAKGLELAIEAAKKGGFKLKIAGSKSGYYSLPGNANKNIEFLGYVSDSELGELYKGAKAFLALSKDEDFGITPVESMLMGTPVIAFNGGGYKETVIDGKTGLLFDDYSINGLIKAIKEFEDLKIDPKDCISQAQKFNKERFKKEIKNFIEASTKKF